MACGRQWYDAFEAAIAHKDIWRRGGLARYTCAAALAGPRGHMTNARSAVPEMGIRAWAMACRRQELRVVLPVFFFGGGGVFVVFCGGIFDLAFQS